MQKAKFNLRLVTGLDPDEPIYLKLGITRERVAEIEQYVQDVANKDGITSNAVVLAESVKIAQNEEELAYICYIVGMAMANAYSRERIEELLKLSSASTNSI